MKSTSGWRGLLGALCHENGALLIFDEVKTGCKLAPGGATEHYGIKPDIVCVAKALAGGLPLGAIAADEEILENVGNGSVIQVGTLGANPLGPSSANLVLRHLPT